MSRRRPGHIKLVLTQPWKLIRSLYHTGALGTALILNRLLLPFAYRPVDFRTELYRCYLGGFLANFWDLIFKAPLSLRETQYADLTLGGVPCVVIPKKAPTSLLHACDRPDLILLYAHGGGYYFGEPLMYIAAYERWVRQAHLQGLKLVIVSVDYRLADEAKFPACRDDFVSAYCSLIQDFVIDPAMVVLGGDSAGGGLVAMSVLEIRRREVQLPGGMLMVSPWLDLEMAETLYSPAILTDFLITFPKDNPVLVNAFLPEGMMASDPQISPIFDDLHSLPPQLVLAGTAEILLPDSLAWTNKSKEAGNKVELILGHGQMHIYAVGRPFSSQTVEIHTDKQILRFLLAIAENIGQQ